MLLTSLLILSCADKNSTDTAKIEPDSNSLIYDEPTEFPAEINNYDGFFDLGTRFNSISKTELSAITSFADLIAEEHANRIISYKSMEVIVLDEDGRKTDLRLSTDSGVFTPVQLDLLRSTGYSDNLMFRADYTERRFESTEIDESYWTPHLTVVPEKQANYKNGKQAFLDYLANNTEDFRDGNNKRFQPGKLHFIVGKDGSISKFRISASTGSTELDERMLELLSETPGAWEPAVDAKGKKVDQELVVSFGNMGC